MTTPRPQGTLTVETMCRLAGVSRAYVCGTAQVLRRGHPLELALRDVHGMAVNWERIRRMLFDAGGVLLGREPRYRAM